MNQRSRIHSLLALTAQALTISGALITLAPSTVSAADITTSGMTATYTIPSATTTTDSLTVVSKQTGPAFTENLVLGSSGADVERLQRYLNMHGCPLAMTGPGSYQMETSYFGVKTKAALVCFQTDTGVIPATGNLGPLTREYISTLP